MEENANQRRAMVFLQGGTKMIVDNGVALLPGLIDRGTGGDDQIGWVYGGQVEAMPPGTCELQGKK